jgi:dihydroneopterin aldolase
VTKIEIIDYPVFIKLGCFSSERLHGQEVLISLTAWLKQGNEPGVSDCLDNTLDYGILMSFISEKYSYASINLIETILNDLGECITSKYDEIDRLEVSVEKTILPESIAKGGRVRISGEFSRKKIKT